LVMVERLVGKEERELFVASSTRIDGATVSTPLGQSWIDRREWRVCVGRVGWGLDGERRRGNATERAEVNWKHLCKELGKVILDGGFAIFLQLTLSFAFCRATIPVLAQISLPFFCF
jgi:hypothetical protein